MRGIPSRAHRTLALSAYRTSASVDARKARRDPVLLQAPRYWRYSFFLPLSSCWSGLASPSAWFSYVRQASPVLPSGPGP